MKKLLVVVGLSLALGSCASTPSTADVCLFQPTKAATTTVSFEGQDVGFCCDKCANKFKAMSDAEKKAKLMAK